MQDHASFSWTSTLENHPPFCTRAWHQDWRQHPIISGTYDIGVNSHLEMSDSSDPPTHTHTDTVINFNHRWCGRGVLYISSQWYIAPQQHQGLVTFMLSKLFTFFFRNILSPQAQTATEVAVHHGPSPKEEQAQHQRLHRRQHGRGQRLCPRVRHRGMQTAGGEDAGQHRCLHRLLLPLLARHLHLELVCQ